MLISAFGFFLSLVEIKWHKLPPYHDQTYSMIWHIKCANNVFCWPQITERRRERESGKMPNRNRIVLHPHAWCSCSHEFSPACRMFQWWWNMNFMSPAKSARKSLGRCSFSLIHRVQEYEIKYCAQYTQTMQKSFRILLVLRAYKILSTQKERETEPTNWPIVQTLTRQLPFYFNSSPKRKIEKRQF